MVELRKRKSLAEPISPPAPKSFKKAIDQVKKTVTAGPSHAANRTGKLIVGDTIQLDGFGGEVETHTGEKTNLKKLVDDSNAGVVLFTYPKASTPGCTTQACLFRDNYSSLITSGLSVYGLSTDSPQSNRTFAKRQSLPYPLLCDPSAKLISAIGLKKSPKGTLRGVMVVDKTGKVIAYEQGGPQRTVDVVMQALPEEVLPEEDVVSSVVAPAPDTVAANEGAASSAGDFSMSGGVGATDVADEPHIGNTPEQKPQQETEEPVKIADEPNIGNTPEQKPQQEVEEPVKIADEPNIGITPEQKPQHETEEQVKTAEIAAQVADTAEKIDKNVELGPSA